MFVCACVLSRSAELRQVAKKFEPLVRELSQMKGGRMVKATRDEN